MFDLIEGVDVPAFAEKCLDTLEEKKPVITPGGRAGNDRRTGSRSNGRNWVERTTRGSLPRYIRIVRNGLMKHGHSEGRATALAVAAIKRWARGGDNVSPKVRAAAAKALAEWEAMKAEKSFEPMYWESKRKFNAEQRRQAHTLPDGSFPIENEEDLRNAIRQVGRAKDPAKARAHIRRQARRLGLTSLIPDTWDEKSANGGGEVVGGSSISDASGQDASISTEEKADHMNIEHKTVGVNGLKVLEEDEGIITAFVSVTGVKDNVNDIIEPGAYAKTLEKRLPKGVWSHDWNTPVSKTLDIKELLPGDSNLPKSLPNGESWPEDAGALQVKMQFNLNTQRGRDAYEDVKFFGEQQEWSIGYNVPVGGSTKDAKAGTRKIQYLDLYEFSPVLFGAMPSARTAMGVKEAQFAHREYKSILGDDYYMRLDVERLDEFVNEAKELLHSTVETKSMFGTETEATSPASDYEDDDEVLPIFTEKGILSAENLHLLEKAAGVITELLDAIQDGEVKIGDDDIETKESPASLTEAVDFLADTDFDEKTLEEMYYSVDEFEAALEGKDDETAEGAANAILDIVDDNLDSVDEKTAEALRGVAKALQDVVLAAMKDAEEVEPVADDYEEEPTPKPSEEDQGEKSTFDTTEVKSLEDFLNSLS